MKYSSKTKIALGCISLIVLASFLTIAPVVPTSFTVTVGPFEYFSEAAYVSISFHFFGFGYVDIPLANDVCTGFYWNYNSSNCLIHGIYISRN